MTENETKENQETYGLTYDIQKKIVAMILADKQVLEENIRLVKPEYFDSLVLGGLMTLITNFFNKYSRPPTEDELLQELEAFLGKDEKLPSSEYLDVYEEIVEIAKDSNFDYIKDNVVDFGRFQAFKKAIEEAVEKRLEKRDYDGIVNSINEAASIGSKDEQLRILSDIEAKDVEWLWQNHIPLGELTLVIGDPGTGKSYFSYFLSAQISKGGSWPDAPDKPIESGKILILSTDEDPNYAIRPRSDAAGADTDKIVVLEGSRDEKGRIKILNLTRDIHRLEDILKKDKSYRLVVIDPLSDYIGHVDTHKYSDVRWALAPIPALARKYHVAIVGIMHCNKNTSLQVLYRIMGSMGFPSVARSIWLIAKDRDDEKGKRRYFAPLKNNLAPEQDTFAFNLDNLGKVAKVVFESKPVEDGFDIEEALVPQEKAGETKRAKKFLLDILKDGAMPMKEIKSAARDEAISWGTLRRAYDKMRGRGIRSFKEKKAGGKWFWELDEFTRRKALVEANAESRSVKEKVEEAREKYKEGSVEEARPLAPEPEPEMSEKEKIKAKPVKEIGETVKES